MRDLTIDKHFWGSEPNKKTDKRAVHVSPSELRFLSAQCTIEWALGVLG